jgi:hypothetical protein
MITAQDMNVSIFAGNTLSKEARNKLNESDVILSSTPISESEIGKYLQSYK